MDAGATVDWDLVRYGADDRVAEAAPVPWSIAKEILIRLGIDPAREDVFGGCYPVTDDLFLEPSARRDKT